MEAVHNVKHLDVRALSALASLQDCKQCLEQQIIPHLSAPLSSASSSQKSFLQKVIANRLFAVCLSYLLVCVLHFMSIRLPSYLTACSFSQSLSCVSFFLSLCTCQPSSCTNYLSPSLLTCQWILMVLLILAEQLDSLPTTTQHSTSTLHCSSGMLFSHLCML